MRGEVTTTDRVLGQVKGFFSEIFDAVKEQFEPTDAEKEKAFFDAVNNVPRLRQLLPYAGYQEDTGLFVVDDGADGQCLGFVIEFDPQTGANEDMESVLQQIFRMGPADTGVQVMMFGSPNIEKNLHQQAMMTQSEDPIHHDILRFRHNYLRRLTTKSLLDTGSYLLRDFRSWVAVTVPVNDVRRVGDQDMVTNLRESIKGVLQSAHLGGWVWEPSDLIEFLLDVTDHRRLYLKHPEEKDRYDEGRFIRDHVRSGGMTDIKQDELVNWWPEHDLRTRTIGMSAISYPEQFELYQSSGMIGSYFDEVLAYPCPFLITLGSWALNKNSAKQTALFKKSRAQKLHEGPMGNMLPEIKQNLDDWDGMIRAIDAGFVSVRMFHQVLLFAPDKGAAQVVQKVESIWRSLGFTMLPDTFEQGQAFFSSLPMNLTQGMQDDLVLHGRAGTKYSNNAIATSPVVGEWKGTGTPSMILFGRRGQCVNFDPYDNKEGNYNVNVAGSPGSGKSVFMNEFQRSFIAQGGRVWNFDSGYSYVKLNSVLKGQYIQFTNDSKINSNPFTHVKDIEDEMDALVSIFTAMISEKGDLPDFQRAVLKGTIFKVFSEYGTDATPTNVWLALKDWRNDDGAKDNRVSDMIQQLEDWTIHGTLGRWMNGRSNINFDNDYVLLELNELKNKAMLRNVIMNQMTLRITQEMFSDRERRKLMLMDEAWDLMQGMNGDFMEDLVRRVRKQKGSLTVGTQGINDFYTKSDASRVVYEQSDTTMLFRQKAESLMGLEKDSRLSASPYDLRVIKSLRTIRSEFWPNRNDPDNNYRGGYSEVFIKSASHKGMGRLILDPYSLLLYSSLPEDFTAVDAKLKQGLAVNEAIKAVLADRGVRV